MWNEITKNLTSRRDSFIYSIDPIGNLGCRSSTEAIRFLGVLYCSEFICLMKLNLT